MITLGTSYEDKVTGFIGVAVSRTEYLYDSTQIGLQATQLCGGKPLSLVYFNEAALVKKDVKEDLF